MMKEQENRIQENKEWGKRKENRTKRIKASRSSIKGAHGSLVVKTLGYKPKSRGFETR
jgi:hypothetical protein